VAGGYNPRQLVTNPMGVAAGLIAAITYGSYTILSKRSLARHSASTTVMYALVFRSIFLTLISMPRLNQLWGLPGSAWGLILALALGPTLGAYALYVKELSHIEASHASIVCMAEPAATAVLAIGRTFTANPRLLLVDEVSTGLIPIFVDKVFDALSELNRRGVSILLVEQNSRKSLSTMSRGYVLETGRISLEGHSDSPLELPLHTHEGGDDGAERPRVSRLQRQLLGL